MVKICVYLNLCQDPELVCVGGGGEGWGVKINVLWHAVLVWLQSRSLGEESIRPTTMWSP